MTISRRAFVSASAAFALAPALNGRALAVPLPREADIVVIGAGAAGIAAARRAVAANRKVIVIEASERIGGRALTDTATFDGPFDRGARWMHNPDTNPLVKLAREAGMETYPAPLGQKIRIGRRYARAGETEDFLATLVRANRAIDDLARKADMSCATALPKDLGDWAATVEFVLGAYATGKDLKDLSAMDQVRAQDRNAAVGCRQGIGALIGKLGEGLPVALATPATRIIWSGRDVSVETPAGRVSARAAIVTASSNVLAAGNIKFTPDLPKRQLDAAAKLSLGSYDHIALQLSGNPLGLERNEAIIEQSSGTRTAVLLANMAASSSLCSIDVAGSFGRDLSAQGEAAMLAFAVEWLTKLYGSDVAAAVKRTSATRWNAAPYVLGAMSAAAPGGQGSRRILMEPVGSVFLAGEAAHETLWGTVNGAWESGERAAAAALQKIGALKQPAPAAPGRKPARRQQRT
jgi:monoamine oxidase